MKPKRIYSFEVGRSEASDGMSALLGGKGANLTELAGLGVPVPPGMTITTQECRHYLETRVLPDSLFDEVLERLIRLEELTGRKFGDAQNPLLLAVRSGGPVFMPGMMETIMYVGLNEQNVNGLPTPVGQDCLHRLREKVGPDFPDDPHQQLAEAIHRIFDSWNVGRARQYRKLHQIPEHLGTACTIQAIVYGNLNSDSGAGVAFTRDPSTGQDQLKVEFLIGQPGDDLVAGVATPVPALEFQARFPGVYRVLQETRDRVETRYRDLMEVEFTVENRKLWVLQVMFAPRSAQASVRCAVEMAESGLVDRNKAILRVRPTDPLMVSLPQVVDNGRQPIVCGIAASPGAVIGQAVMAAEQVGEYERSILIRANPNPDDVSVIDEIGGLVTAIGGSGAHFSVVSRNRGVPAVVGCNGLRLKLDTAVFNGTEIKKGDWLTIDGSGGKVFSGQMELEKTEPGRHLGTLLDWCSKWHPLGIRAFADSADQVAVAQEMGVQIAISTERMFMGDNLGLLQQVILADQVENTGVLDEFLSRQQAWFEEIFRIIIQGSVIIRLLDPPLCEFLPDPEGLPPDDPRQEKIRLLQQNNPLLGHRGCRLTVTHPLIYEMQLRAIMRALKAVNDQDCWIRADVLVPLVSSAAELRDVRQMVDRVADEVIGQTVRNSYSVGAMIETPRAALTASQIAEYADFLDIGLMDLAQCTFGVSRDDANAFLGSYLERGIWPQDPFAAIDQEGVGRLIEIACREARETKPDIPIEITVWDPESIEFAHQILIEGEGGFVCPLPFVPQVKLVAAQAALKEQE